MLLWFLCIALSTAKRKKNLIILSWNRYCKICRPWSIRMKTSSRGLVIQMCLSQIGLEWWRWPTLYSRGERWLHRCYLSSTPPTYILHRGWRASLLPHLLNQHCPCILTLYMGMTLVCLTQYAFELLLEMRCHSKQ